MLVIGLAIGGTSGYFGGRIDDVLQRLCEMVMLLPGFYLLLMLRFMFPPNMDSTKVYFAVVLILSLVGWAGFARVIRGMVLSIRKEDYVQAARAMGLRTPRIIAKHVLPNTMGYVIVATTLRIPGYILGESALSLLGLGIMEPTPSWGNMLQKAMDILELEPAPVGALAGRVHLPGDHGVQPGRRRAARRGRPAGADEVTRGRRERGSVDVPAHTAGSIASLRLTRVEDQRRTMQQPLLEIKDLNVAFDTDRGPIRRRCAMCRSRSIPGQTVALVGESGLRQVGHGACRSCG